MQDLDSLILNRSRRARKCSPTRRTSVTLDTYMKVKSKRMAGNGTLSRAMARRARDRMQSRFSTVGARKSSRKKCSSERRCRIGDRGQRDSIDRG